MALPRSVPGLYREDRFVRRPVALPTGVPAFVGFGTMSGGLEVVERIDQFVQRWSAPLQAKTFLAAAVAGFFANGGTRCFVAAIGDPGSGSAAALAAFDDLARVLDPDAAPGADGTSNPARARALDQLGRALAALTQVDLVAAPDAMAPFDPLRVVSVADLEPNPADTYTLLLEKARALQASMLAHCTRSGARVAVLDPPPRVNDPAAVLIPWLNRVTIGARAENAAMYFPWIRSIGASADSPVPPSGHVAGVIARSDAQVGVYKAPANEEIIGAVDLHYPVGDAGQVQLRTVGINCLRHLPGRGLRVWGAMTASRDPEWRQLAVRRLFLTVERWIAENMTWAAFEPNSERLWVRIRRELGVYLEQLWRAGGLAGRTASEAFFIKCDAETNPPEARELGQVVTELGLAPVLPAEFIVVRITQREGATRFN